MLVLNNFTCGECRVNFLQGFNIPINTTLLNNSTITRISFLFSLLNVTTLYLEHFNCQTLMSLNLTFATFKHLTIFNTVTIAPHNLLHTCSARISDTIFAKDFSLNYFQHIFGLHRPLNLTLFRMPTRVFPAHLFNRTIH